MNYRRTCGGQFATGRPLRQNPMMNKKHRILALEYPVFFSSSLTVRLLTNGGRLIIQQKTGAVRVFRFPKNKYKEIDAFPVDILQFW